MPYEVDFTCTKCNKDFTADWGFGDEVTCPNCGTTFETDYDTTYDDDTIGPWLGGVVEKNND